MLDILQAGMIEANQAHIDRQGTQIGMIAALQAPRDLKAR